VPTDAPRRSALLQTRSRATRRKLIRAALELWGDRGFEKAFEETTAEEIARAAGVSKGTFYFHFAHKEDVLLEMSWATAEIMLEEAEALMGRGEPTAELVEQLMTSLAKRVARVPRAAVLLATGRLSRHAMAGPVAEPKGFGEAFHVVLTYGCERGDLPEGVAVDDVAALLQAATMDSLLRWAATDAPASSLREALSRRADVILRGAAVSYGA
jgi:AcrR family transcriptional regulator